MKAGWAKIREGGPIFAAAALCCAALSTACWIFAIGPALAQREARAGQTAQLEIRHRKADALTSQLAAVHRRRQAVEQSLLHSSLHLQSARIVNDRLARLTDLANAAGLSIEQIQPGQTANGPHYQTVALKLAGSGTYPAVARFLNQLHEKFPDTGVRAIDSTSGGTDPLAPLVNFRFELTWYAAPLPAAPIAKAE